MFKKLAEMIDRPLPQDWTQEEIERHPIWSKQERVLGATVLCFAMALVSIFLFYVINHTPRPAVLWMVEANHDGERTVTQRLPNMSPLAIQNWARDATQSVYTFNWLNADDQLEESRQYFTSDGWASFLRTWRASSIYKTAMSQKLSVSITPTVAPINADSIETKNFSAWQYKVPAIINFTGDIPTTPQHVIITLTIVAVPTTDNPKGLGITQFLTEAGSAN